MAKRPTKRRNGLQSYLEGVAVVYGPEIESECRRRLTGRALWANDKGKVLLDVINELNKDTLKGSALLSDLRTNS